MLVNFYNDQIFNMKRNKMQAFFEKHFPHQQVFPTVMDKILKINKKNTYKIFTKNVLVFLNAGHRLCEIAK